ncbi:MAG: transposase [Geminicoccaceae bacterium]
MMGRLEGGSEKLFYEFSLEDAVPSDHLLRKIDRFLDFDGLRSHLRPYYSDIGRPSVDPELMIRMLLVGYCFAIRSERRLCEEVHLNLAYRWFCRLGIEDRVPDHSTFSKARHGRFRESDLFRKLFETTVVRCMSEGLVKGEGFATDASLIRADASRKRSADGEEDIDWSDAVLARRLVAEYLEAVELQNKPPKTISLTDPGARWTSAMGGPAYFAWSTNYLVDVQAAVIVDVEPTTVNRSAEVESTKLMIDRSEARFGLKPRRLIGDTAYGTAEMLAWIVEEKAIEPHVPLWEKAERDDGTFGRSDFVFDAASNSYRCPGGKLLKQYRRKFKRRRSGVTKAKTRIYRASQFDCRACALKAKCCPGQPMRKVSRSVHEVARDVVRRLEGTPAYRRSRNERKKVEMLFAHLKRIMKLDRLRLRGASGARDEFLLAATVQNLRKLAKLVPEPGPPGASWA